MHRIIICAMALLFSIAVSAQTSKKGKKNKPTTEQTDSTATSKPESDSQKEQVDTTKKFTPKKDYKKANNKAKPKPTTSTKTPATKTKPTPRPKPMTAAEKKQAEKDSLEKDAVTPKGVEALYYKIPADILPVVTEFMAVKQEMSPHARIKDDISLRKQIIRYKNIDKGYMELQKPGDTKYTRIQIFKKSNNDLVLVVEQSNCNPYCIGTMKFYTGTPAGTKWKDATEELYPKVDSKYMIGKLKAKYKKEYKDLDIYNSKGYEENEANFKKAITYAIAPDDAKILISEQYLPCTLYEMIWDANKGKFELKKVDK